MVLTSLEQSLDQALPGGQAAGVVGGHPPQQRLHKAVLDRLRLIGCQGVQLSLDGGALCRWVNIEEEGDIEIEQENPVSNAAALQDACTI